MGFAVFLLAVAVVLLGMQIENGCLIIAKALVKLGERK